MSESENNSGYISEDITEKILNKTFFQDFVFRSPKKKDKNNKELADVVVCFDDVILVVQIKKQFSKKDPVKWSEKNITKAVSQVTGAVNSINEKEIDSLSNDRIGKIDLCRSKYKYIYGLVIIDQESKPYDVSEYVKEAQEKYKVAIQIMSLKDFYNVCRVFCTAEEFFHYYELKDSIEGSKNVKIQDEAAFVYYLVNNFSDLSCSFALSRCGVPQDKNDFMVAQEFYKKRLIDNNEDEYKYSLIIDMLIERMHKIGGGAEEYKKKKENDNIAIGYSEVAHELAKTARMTRIIHGKEIFKRLEMCRKNPEAEPSFTIESQSRETAYFYYFPKYQRTPEEIFDFIRFYGVKKIKESQGIKTVICSAIQNDPQFNERYFFAMVKGETNAKKQ